jgi:hypothetical protein
MRTDRCHLMPPLVRSDLFLFANRIKNFSDNFWTSTVQKVDTTVTLLGELNFSVQDLKPFASRREDSSLSGESFYLQS